MQSHCFGQLGGKEATEAKKLELDDIEITIKISHLQHSI